MNAPTSFDLEAQRKGPTPDDLEITVRDERFARGIKARRWWLNGDPVATAWMNALSATFPRGEAFFIESVKAFRDGADPKLTAEIRAFVKQEINHTREHVAFNRMASDAGYDIAAIDKRVEEMLAELKDRPQILNLAATMALEHFTAMLGHELLKKPKYLEGADGDLGDLWRWHSAEEIEHKGVAYDTWLHATRGWSRYKRWKVKSLMMLLVTVRFIKHRSEDTMDLLRQDGLTGWKWRMALAKYLLVSPGFLSRIIPGWLAYFMPGFHPWNEDDRELIQLYEGDFEDALMQPAE
ncbi:metal-dependent hydrolase [Altererythrobacter lutimaris]|uniref:Metal-dependent hydrolase n=1 Tax=Altererythrobacter lutimaris TaxID=2743979 RepID=A0A850HB78_9SPHN|nr:metal-dependent hydrolase [Altererythrobacter lutimaris]NVE94505.1 metal-dependent hydrolase [Altererythrobacter lutimaris]